MSDERGGVTQISPEGATRLYRGHTADAQTLAANGFALLADGSFLIAPLAGSGVFRLKRDGEAELFLGEADGHALECPNFVLLDGCDRVWICCMTQQRRSAVGSFRRDKRDGFIVLVDERGARIVADGIGFPNEVRVDPPVAIFTPPKRLPRDFCGFRSAPTDRSGRRRQSSRWTNPTCSTDSRLMPRAAHGLQPSCRTGSGTSLRPARRGS